MGAGTKTRQLYTVDDDNFAIGDAVRRSGRCCHAVAARAGGQQAHAARMADDGGLAVGDEVVVSFDLESREVKGRWYTDVRAWKIEKVQASAPAHGEGSVPPPPADFEPNAQTDDLPF